MHWRASVHRVLSITHFHQFDMIAHVFVFNFGACKEDKWEELDMVNRITSMFNNTHPRTDIRSILRDVLVCKKEKKLYEGKTNRSNSGQKVIVGIDSLEAQMFADILKETNSMQIALQTINGHQKETEKPELSISVL